MSSDRIEKSVFLKAPRSRVWKALTDAEEFGAWFGMRMKDPFVVGKTVRCVLEGALPSQEEMDKHAQEAGLAPHAIAAPESDVFCVVEQMEPERFFSFRWIPYGIDAGIDWTKEPMTLVTFTLTEEAGGTRLVVVESGFDKVPAERRERAFRMNEGGWKAQMENIAKHLGAN